MTLTQRCFDCKFAEKISALEDTSNIGDNVITYIDMTLTQRCFDGMFAENISVTY